MESKIDLLLAAYEPIINEPWTGTLSVSERVWFLVFNPGDLRKVSLRLGDFETLTKKSGKRWEAISFKDCFPSWIDAHDYRDEYFNDPEALIDQLEAEFKEYAIDFLNNNIAQLNTNKLTLLAILDVSALFGFVKLVDVLGGINSAFKGRILIFFPGKYEPTHNHYCLLDVRDGRNYLARPIIA
jgi:hypothetical protein